MHHYCSVQPTREQGWVAAGPASEREHRVAVKFTERLHFIARSRKLPERRLGFLNESHVVIEDIRIPLTLDGDQALLRSYLPLGDVTDRDTR